MHKRGDDKSDEEMAVLCNEGVSEDMIAVRTFFVLT